MDKQPTVTYIRSFYVPTRFTVKRWKHYTCDITDIREFFLYICLEGDLFDWGLMGDSSSDSEGYERPVTRCKCNKHVQFVCEACQRSLCKSCVGEHVADRKSGSHDVKYHHSFRDKVKKVHIYHRSRRWSRYYFLLEGIGGRVLFARGYKDQKYF